MARWSEVFRQAWNAAGFTFDYGREDATRLDAFLDEWLEIGPNKDDRETMANTSGAYLGELLIRHGNGRWVWADWDGPAVELPNGLVANPHGKVSRRFDEGPKHNIHAFYHYALSREMLPGTNLTKR
jgi:hypothetical protein